MNDVEQSHQENDDDEHVSASDDTDEEMEFLHDVKPIFANTLRFKTKIFKTPFNIQYLGTFQNETIFSDGVHSHPMIVSKSSRDLFINGRIKPLSIITVKQTSRQQHSVRILFYSIAVKDF